MEGNSKGVAVTAGIVAVIGISLLALLAMLNRRDQVVGLNQEIQYDDFAFSVQGIRTASTLGKGESHANPHGLYYIVTVKIANHAKRVNYRFKYSSARLVDVLKREFALSVAGQKALDSENGIKCAGPIPAGGSCVTEVVFDLPANTELKQFRISEGGLVGDILDVIFYGRKRIELGSIQYQ